MPSLTIGSINRVHEAAIQLGGKGVNVSTMLKTLGHQSVALGFTAGRTGAALEEGLKAAGQSVDFTRLASGFTRINVKIKAGQETEINGAGPLIASADVEALAAKLEALVDGDALVLAGAAPPGAAPDVYARLLARVQNRRVLAVVDAAGELFRRTLAHEPFLVKPNRLELEEICGRRLADEPKIVEAARELRQKGARNVLVSLAGDGALLVDQDGQAWRMGSVAGNVRNSVGAGDSMVAGFLAGHLSGRDFGQALKLGAAAGTATAFSAVMADQAAVLAMLAQLPEPVRLGAASA
jgi:1-phosphofructokinase